MLSLMGVLLASVTTYLGSSATHVRNRMDLANVIKIEGAAQLYQIDVGLVPASVEDLVHCPIGVSGWCGPYLDEVPKNPFDSAQSYQLNSLGRVK